MSICRCFCGLIFVFALCLTTLSQQNEKSICRQNSKAKLQAVKNAEKNKYRISQIEISGNIFTYDRDYRQKMVVEEGNIFTRKALDETIENLNKWEVLKPITIKNMKVSLDTENKDVYMIICVEEKRKIKQ